MDAINIKIRQFHVRDESLFDQVHSFQNNGICLKRLVSSFLNKSQENRLQYVPKVHIEERWTTNTLRSQQLVVEFSAPKLLYGNNLEETVESDLSRVVRTIKKYLRQIGIDTTASLIRTATVTSIEYARNIRLQRVCTSHRLLEILSRMDYRPRSEFSSITRGSHSEVKFWNKSARFVAYDKLRHINDCAVTNEEKEIARCIANPRVESHYRDLIQETVRFELALQDKNAVVGKMKQFYRTKRDYTLQEVFRDHIRDALLAKEMRRVFDYPILPILLMESNERQDIEIIEAFTASKRMREQLAYAMCSMRLYGLSTMRDRLIRDSSDRSWDRINKQLKDLGKFAGAYLASRPTSGQIVGLVKQQFGIRE